MVQLPFLAIACKQQDGNQQAIPLDLDLPMSRRRLPYPELCLDASASLQPVAT
jgi:hypothetical protein